ncbi:MAG TPA: thioredoxin domain-containing protein [Gaiellaceae bacterium]|nr:thioredoxin domain-containing protein [Gaiellaceae bacterium]
MPSGKRARQQRRTAAAAAPPPVRSKGVGGARTRQASPRALAIAGAIVALVVVAIVLGVALGKGSGGATSGAGDSQTIHAVKGTPAVGSSKSPVALQGAPEVAKLLKGIPQNHFVLGSPNAPVELTEFIDLQCPVCKAFETEQFPTLVQKYVSTGKLRVKMEPWSILDRPGTGVVDSDRGQKVTIAAAAQNKAFEFTQVLYINQGDEDSNWLNDSMVSQIAASVDGLKPAQLVSDANSAATKSIVHDVDRIAAAHPNEFYGTPTLLLSKGHGKPQYFGTGQPDLGKLEAAIDALLK